MAPAFRLADEMALIGFLMVKPDGTISVVNRELERQFGYAREELIGRSVDVLLPEGLRSLHAAHREGFAHAPEARQMGAGRDLFGRRKDGSLFPVEIGLSPVNQANGTAVMATVVDITERRRLDSHRADLEDQLEFERFVAELSGQFINSPTDRIDDVIRNGFRRACEMHGIDRGTLYSIQADGSLPEPVSWARAGLPPVSRRISARDAFPWTLERILAGEVVSFTSPDDIHSETDRHSYRSFGTRSAFVVPLKVSGRVAGAVAFGTVRAERRWTPEVAFRLRAVANIFGEVLARRESDESLRTALAELELLKDSLESENVFLRQEAGESLRMTHVVGQSPAVRQVLHQIEQVAQTDSTVLLLGETGSGKELFATQIHELSARRKRPMVRVNCAAIPATLIESELFGREKGAYTGALSRQVGRFELADHSTIFLDEIGDLPADAQVKLLRVLEERRIERLGSPQPITVDARVIAATHQNLEQRIAEGLFREDLFYRLNVFPIRIPPLRERAEDIPLMVWRFVEEFSKAFGRRIDSIAKESLSAMQHYSWPGNVRELRNVVERAMITASGSRLTVVLPTASAASMRRSARLADVEKEHIRSVLESTGWRVRGAGGAADRLGLKPTTLETRMVKLGLRRPGH